ncbi:MAG: hypothetical protein ACI3V2_07395 [Faecousia sp.]
MKGKNKCKILKQIRQRIADENDIPLVTQECGYQGECSGTCPKCEQELRYLEQQLARRQALGKRVTVAALAAGMLATMTGCPAPQTPDGTALVTEDTQQTTMDFQTVGIVPMTEDATEPDGRIPSSSDAELPTEPEEPFELAGDVVYIPEETDD